ncbi:thiamine phosphate synthase [Agrobacterium tumefaciens]|uniref:Thiamine phosphate synthase n=1 Tax=Agrobacterium tumefaciens TaxID=358 RepID=A0A2L2LHJ5_AGRTU|nr:MULTISPECIES: thiamine phosphate synthase [Rhizobium/Agrobacterium group]MCZ7493939.1 thiamine phosphate synthase [Rhizobium rhizogenes]AVH43805.1 thiamine-phosphate pyrophosphorylase [Agrobacterium tumefaciens]MBW9072307.1 thiamine phosphate synthase [Agrobacterium deltaense]MDA5242309.1 thiamine phosphate synthase [Agrobacterium sp. MAFF310724]MDA5248311.1 thiamine phosphate synthase [Agrobacterium sp. MAFF210268]
MTLVEDRCRLVLIVPQSDDAQKQATEVEDALRGGDVASVIIPQYGLDDAAFQKRAELIVPLVQKAGAAALIAGDSRVAGRVKADGLHVVGNGEALAEAVEKFTPKLIVGGGNADDRHKALEQGEANPDYVFFGKLEGDIKPEAHPKNLALGEWWASMIEIPAIVMGGTDVSSVVAVAETGVEFVAMRSGVFDNATGAAQAVSEINALLDEKAPRFDG